ncbi:MAG: rhomboid family intramembrane serine protease [Terriglobia bacterium]
MNPPPAAYPPPNEFNWRRLPAATCVILALNVVIFILMTLSGGSQNTEVLLAFGASYGPYFRAGEIWRLVMPMFLHIGVAHLAVNMVALYLLGSLLEPLYGYGRFSLLYVLSGMGGSLLSMEASPHIAAGASGAIFGVAGAMLVTGLLRPQIVPRRWKSLFGVGILLAIIINLIFGRFVPHIDNWAHLGGLAAGLALACIIPPVVASKEIRAVRGVQPIVIIPAVLVALAIGATANHRLKTGQASQLIAGSLRLEKENQTGRAISLLEEARRLDPHSEIVREQLGELYLDTQRYPQAIAEFQQALRFSPLSNADVVRLAIAYEQSGDPGKARSLLEEAQRKVPDDAGIQETLAEVYGGLKMFPAAILHYGKALKLAPNSPVALNNLAWLYATCPDARYRNPAAALQCSLRAVQLTGWRQPVLLDTLAAALDANGKASVAAQVETAALQLDPQNRAYQDALAKYHRAAGQASAGR